MNNTNRPLIAIVLGVSLGFAASRLLFLQYLTLIPWGVAGLLVGYISKPKKEAIKNGAIYGFCLGFVFIASVYQGSAPILTRVPFFAMLGVVGAICAIVLGIIGFFLGLSRS